MECDLEGSIESLTEDIIIVECPSCKVAEVSAVLSEKDNLDHFMYIDERIAKA